MHGARIAATVISDPKLFARWNEEMGEMAGRELSAKKCHNVIQNLALYILVSLLSTVL